MSNEEQQQPNENHGKDSTQGSLIREDSANQNPTQDESGNSRTIQAHIKNIFNQLWNSYRVRQSISDIRFWLEIAALVGVVAYTRYTSQQVDLTRGQLEITRQSMIWVQRAFVSFTGVENKPFKRHPKDVGYVWWEFYFGIRNNGVTPARHADIRVSAAWLPRTMPRDFEFRDTDNTSAPKLVTLGAGQDTGAGPITIDIQHINLVNRNAGHLYFWGWVLYRDVFPNTKSHITMFCKELSRIDGDPPHPDPNATPGFLYESCDHHNCEDEECNGEPYGTDGRRWNIKP